VRQVDAGAYATQAMNLQGFYLRGGVDSTAVEAQFNYTRRAADFQAIGGAQFLSTFFDVPPPQNLLPSTYQVLSLTLSIRATITLPCHAERAPVPPRCGCFGAGAAAQQGWWVACRRSVDVGQSTAEVSVHCRGLQVPCWAAVAAELNRRHAGQQAAMRCRSPCGRPGRRAPDQ